LEELDERWLTVSRSRFFDDQSARQTALVDAVRDRSGVFSATVGTCSRHCSGCHRLAIEWIGMSLPNGNANTGRALVRMEAAMRKSRMEFSRVWLNAN
jgi:hypothetical protein